MIFPALLILFGLWGLISLTRFLWHVRAGQQVRAATTKFERPMAAAPTQILIAGDSVVFGVGASHPESSIAGLFGRDWPSASIVNIGVSGAETDGLAQQLQSVAGRHFSLVVLIIGANDVVHFKNLKTSRARLDQALTLARHLSDQVILMPEGNMGNAPLFPRLASFLLTPRSRQFRSSAMTVAKRQGVEYVDVFYARRDDAWLRRPKQYYAADFFHPADPGYLDWYHAIREGMGRAGWMLAR